MTGPILYPRTFIVVGTVDSLLRPGGRGGCQEGSLRTPEGPDKTRECFLGFSTGDPKRNKKERIDRVKQLQVTSSLTMKEGG